LERQVGPSGVKRSAIQLDPQENEITAPADKNALS
jgi:hypothetical protein